MAKKSLGGQKLTEAIAGNIGETPPPTPPNPDVTTSETSRDESIRLAAYLRAERRGFEPGHDVEDWLDAEREVGERDGAGAIG